MSLDAREVHRVAALARLRLTAEEEGVFAGQLGRIVEHIDRIRSLEVGALEASDSPGCVEFEDRSEPGLGSEPFLANAPASRETFLVVPRVLGTDDD